MSADVDSWVSTEDGELAVFVQLPTGVEREQLPVLVLSHGLGGDHHGYGRLGAHLASHGYAVLHPQYLDSRGCLVAAGKIDPLAAEGPETDEAVAALVKPMLFDPEHWWSRVRRAHVLLDSLGDQQHLELDLDPVGVAVIGHSYGAYTTQLLMGTRLSGVDPRFDHCAHPAVGCGVLISPQGSGDRGLTPQSWDAVVAPMLVITSERDFGPHGETVDWRREPFDRAGSSLRHLVVIGDTDHHMGGIAATDAASPPEPQGREPSSPPEVVSAFAVAFVQAARGHLGAAGWLAADPLSNFVENEHIGGLR
jgi:dienelactone hydrolase